jgi:hypothetical protein
LSLGFEELPNDPKARHEALVGVFGEHVSLARDTTLERTRALLADPEFRRRIGRVPARAYEAAASSDMRTQQLVEDLLPEILNRFIYELMVIFTSRGNSLRFGDQHAVRYDLHMEIHRIPSEEELREDLPQPDTFVEAALLNVGHRAFMDYFGVWLNNHAKRK